MAEDATGDVSAQVLEAPGASMGGFDHVDIRYLSVLNESLDALTFEISFVTSEVPHDAAPILRQAFRLSFAIGTMAYRLTNAGSCPAVTLETEQADGTYRPKECLDASRPLDGLLQVTVPKRLLTDAQGTPFRIGMNLENAILESKSVILPSPYAGTLPPPFFYPSGASAIDRTPDVGHANYSARIGLPDRGDLRLSSLSPVRISNGEQLRFLFIIELENRGTETLAVDLTSENVPSNWATAVPAKVELPPSSRRSIPALLFRDFSHEHGESITFQVVGRSADHASTVDLSVTYTLPAQPTRHHPQLWFHSGRPPSESFDAASLVPGFTSNGYAWMNTLQVDTNPMATNEPVTGMFREVSSDANGIPEQTWSWFVPLEPSLATGLVWQEAGLVDLSARIQFPAFATSHNVDVVLYHCAQPASRLTFNACTSGMTVVARGQSLEPFQDLADVRLAMPLVASEPLPFRPSSNLVLGINVTFAPAAIPVEPASPTLLMDGGGLHLPLLDYQDDVDFQAPDGLSCDTQLPPSLFLAAGEEASFAVVCKNTSPDSIEVHFQFLGNRQEWARTRVDSLRLDPADEATLMVDVAVNATAELGEFSTAALVAFDGQGRLLLADPFDVEVSSGPTSQPPSRGAPSSLTLVILALLVALRSKR